MLWVTASSVGLNGSATGWLIRRFLDPDAQFCFVAPAQVVRVQAGEAAIGFAVGRGSFEALVDEHQPDDDALRALARIVHGADCSSRTGLGTFDRVSFEGWTSGSAGPPEAAGLRAIAEGFPLVAQDDEEILERGAFLYDALYATLQHRRGR